MFSKFGKIGGIAVAVVFAFSLFGMGQLVETTDAGYFKVRQMPISGTLTWFTTPGMFAQMFGQVTTYKEAGTYRFNDEADVEGISLNSPAIQVRFNDAGIARISGQARFTLPNDVAQLDKVHAKFRSYEGVSNALVQPTIEQAVLLTASLMSAEESYSGRRAEFGQLVEDQVLNGIYLTRFSQENREDARTGEKITVRIVSIQYDEDGNPIRKNNPLRAYGLRITQFFLDKDFTYEEGVLGQIRNAREALMATVAAKAAADRAVQDRLTAEAEGQAAVMTAKYESERIKVKAVVDARREKEVAETNAARQLEVAKLARAEANEYKAQQILIGEGDAERKRLVLEADGALEQKLATYERVQGLWATSFATRPVPGIVMGGGAGGNGGNTDLDTQQFIQLMGVKVLQDLALDNSIKGASTQ